MLTEVGTDVVLLLLILWILKTKLIVSGTDTIGIDLSTPKTQYDEVALP